MQIAVQGTCMGRAGRTATGSARRRREMPLHTPKKSRQQSRIWQHMLVLVQRNRTAHTLLWECEMIHASWKTGWRSLIKLSVYLFSDPAATFLGICPREIYVSFIHNSPKLKEKKKKANQMSVSRKMTKHTAVYSYNGIQLSKIQEWVTDYTQKHWWMSQKFWWVKEVGYKWVHTI